ncbi:hypothetical protein RJ640_018586 [Escallonia rubra]|uniref:SCP domain-containing protein n=1 Tax=Escallonia rubra TaxID=112253 RepID=A0AA88UJL2_9ASTE|nr:hypothetical protein RJ640_018586 [Escallonia rubra]
MGWCNMSVAFLGVLGLIMVHSTQAQNSQQDYLDAHNAARGEVGVGPLTWDDAVAAYAQNYANQRIGDCALMHSQNGPYGENLAIGSGDLSGKAAVDLWVGEKQYYDYNSNSCASGQMCGHYTQVVWRNSARVGCARVQCNNGWWFITCNYDPPGNYVGEPTLVCVLGLSMVRYTLAQNSQQDYLTAQNAARAGMGLTPMTTWDNKVAP